VVGAKGGLLGGGRLDLLLAIGADDLLSREGLFHLEARAAIAGQRQRHLEPSLGVQSTECFRSTIRTVLYGAPRGTQQRKKRARNDQSVVLIDRFALAGEFERSIVG